MLLLICLFITSCTVVICNDVQSEIEGLRRMVGRMEHIIARQEKAISNANEHISSLAKEVSALRSGNSTRGRRQAETAAFTAYLDHQETVHQGNVIKFNQVLQNDGNAYNKYTGIFTVPMTGTYIFSFQVEDWRTNEMPFYLKGNGKNMVDTIIDNNGSTQSGNTAILGLTVGDTVWVESSEGMVYGESTFRGTTFCGAYLY